ncbi:MAG TPA: HDOD domain-containing protein [Tepidisphaeraceae bacterium]|nr:HDOD domain-containing protein [Tepidisphaeraceae bacterium]
MSAATPTAVDPAVLAAQAIAKVNTIAALPEVTTQIIKIVNDPRSSAAQLNRVIAHDPSLVVRILKTVNSSFYGLPGQIGSIERAIVLLGMNAVKNIAVAASLGDLFRGKLCDGYTARDLWTHCISVAMVARQLARETNPNLADEAFLAGMIHDVGILVSLQVWPKQLSASCDQSKKTGIDFILAEREQIGVDHQMLGNALAEKWKFPRSCQLVAGHHHQPAQLADNSRLLVSLVFTADTLCCQANRGFNLTAVNQKLEDGQLEAVSLKTSTIDQVRGNLPKLLESASGLF